MPRPKAIPRDTSAPELPEFIPTYKTERMIGYSLATTYRLIRAGELEQVHVGRSSFVTRDSFLRHKQRRLAEAKARQRPKA